MTETHRILGYPADARLLILNADDVGMSHAINEAVFRAFKEGILQSTSLMMPWPAASEALHVLKQNPDLDFGVHLSVMNDNPHILQKPLAPQDKIPSLVDDTGHFLMLDRRDYFLEHVQISELEIEFRAQIDAVLAEDLTPTHLDWHCLHNGGRPDIFDLSVELAKEYGLALRAYGDPYNTSLNAQNLPANDHIMLDSYTVEIEGKAARYADMLRNLPAGLTEWAVHPGIGNTELQSHEPESWQVRQTDFDFVIAPETREIISQEGIILLGYKPLQACWEKP